MRLLYVVTEDWYFLAHRLPMARAARAAGFEVHVATRIVDGKAAIEAEGFTVHPVPFTRGRLSIAGSVGAICALGKIHRAIRPAIVHHVALQAAILGSLAAGRDTPCVNGLTGLGYVFLSESAKAALLRPFVTALMRRLFNRPRCVVSVENSDDRAAIVALGVADERMVLIRGSGVDVDTLRPLAEPQGPPTIAFVGRLLADKGIHALVRAVRALRARGAAIELLIAGTPDPANPSSLSAEEASALGREPGIAWLGHVKDVASIWARAHIAALPSRREGLPVSLLEAAACARPMIATNVPGCREIVRTNETGLLVPFGDDTALASAIGQLAGAPDLRARYGAAARKLVVERFSADVVGRETVALYRRLAAQDRPA